MLLYICNNACKRSLAICRKSRASCPINRLLSVHIWPTCAKQRRQYDSNKQTNKQKNKKKQTKNTSKATVKISQLGKGGYAKSLAYFV